MAVLVAGIAASQGVSVEPENGTLANGTTLKPDGYASKGSSVKFAAGLGVPQDVQAFTGGSSVAIVWSGVPGASRYGVFRNGVKIGEAVPRSPSLAYINGTRYIDGSVSAGANYNYQVQTMNTAGQVSTLSAVVSVAVPTASQSAPTVIKDTSAAPDLANWLNSEVIPEVVVWYPKLAHKLSYPNYQAPQQITFNFSTDANTVAYAADDVITLGAAWFRAHPDDAGAAIHEAVHVLQGYTQNPPPGWVVEGIADWARYYLYQDQIVSPPGAGANYTDGYRTSAYFLQWIQTRYGKPDFVRMVNIAAHNGTYSDAIFIQQTGKTIDQLWQQMLAGQ